MTIIGRPTGPKPEWATDPTYTTGPDLGQFTRLEPLSGEKAQGYGRSRRVPARKLNWLIGKLADWVGYISDVAVQNWNALYTVDSGGAALDLTGLRPDGSSKCFWSPGLEFWVLLGNSTNGKHYTGGDQGKLFPQSTALAFKVSHGVDAANQAQLVLFCSDGTGAGNRLKYARQSSPYDFTTWTGGVLPGTVTTGAQCLDSLIAGDGNTILAFGGVDSNHLCWRSTDGGTTWASSVVKTPVVLFGTYVARAFVGKNGRVFTYVPAISAVNDGSLLCYSDDNGVTWNTHSLPFDLIADACYIPSADRYVFLHSGLGNGYEVADDPISGTFTHGSFSGTFHSCASIGGGLMVSHSQASFVVGATSIAFSQDVMATLRRVVNVRSSAGGTAYHVAANPNDGQYAWLGTNAFETSLKASEVE